MKKINLLVVGTLVSILGLGMVSCQGIPKEEDDPTIKDPGDNKDEGDPGTGEENPGEEETKPIKLTSVENLLVLRENDKWKVSFDSVENASGYNLKVSLGEETILSEESITSGYTLNPIAETGDYEFSVTALGDETHYLDSDPASYVYKVYAYKDEVVNTVKYNGLTEQGVPVGEFTLTYPAGDVYVGTLYNDFTRKDGRLTYANKMYYEGHFENDSFNGEGMFTWSTTGNYKDGNTYVGNFINGGNEGQIGTIYTVNNWTRDMSIGGILNWTGKFGGTFGLGGKVGETGKGEFVFANNSIYEGDLLITADWAYVRQGQGFNKWTVYETAHWITGGSADVYIYGFGGTFNEANGKWIDGDGIWYFKDAEGNPVSYIKGKWDGGNRVGEATTELTVIDEFKDATDLTPIA